MIVKYKAWDKSEKKMKQVYSIKFNEQGEAIAIQDEFADNYETYVTYDVKYYELLQSTGLFDKNGKEIFQGDIIHYKIEDKSNDGSPYTLRELTGYIYKEGNCMWVKVNDSEIVPLWCLEDQYVIFKILGNIYEHPHLLEEE